MKIKLLKTECLANTKEASTTALQIVANKVEAVTQAKTLSPDNTVEGWAAKFNSSIRLRVTALIGAGRILISAKAQLAHGEFLKLFASGVLHVDERTAQMMMRVAQNTVLGNPNNYSDLPSALHTLYQLARLDERSLKSALLSGKVSATMTLKQAKVLVGRRKKTPKMPSEDNRRDADQTPSTLGDRSNFPAELTRYFNEYVARTREILSTFPEYVEAIEANANEVLTIVLRRDKFIYHNQPKTKIEYESRLKFGHSR